MMLTTSRAEPDAADNASFFRQCQLEQDLQRQAREAWDEARRKDGRRHHGRLVLSALPALSAAIEEMRKRPGPKAIACLAPLSSDQIAYTALRVLLSDALQEQTQQTTAIRIGEALDTELRLNRVRTEEGELWDELRRIGRPPPPARRRTDAEAADGAGQDKKRRRSDFHARLRKIKKKLTEAAEQADDNVECLKVGQYLLQLALDRTSLFDVKYPPKRSRRSNRVVLTAEAEAMIWRLDRELLQWAPPAYQALVAPPAPWTSLSEGGYYSLPLPFIKTRGRNRYESVHRTAFGAGALSAALGAVNALQDVPWSINENVLSAMRRLTEGGKDSALERAVADYAVSDREEVGASGDEDAELAAADVASEWFDRKIVKEVLEPRELDEPFLNFGRVKSLAELYARRGGPFYFTWQLDFRGRAYPVGQHLQPQGHDCARALLQFAEARPLGRTGADWLAIHGANVLKASAVSERDKIRWTTDHEDEICRTARDPRSTLPFWALTADGKVRKTAWCGLAFCFEWERFLAEGSRFRSRLPVAMDGTCNAIQHLAALIRDDELGRLSNIVAAQQRADIYEEVAREVRQAIELAPHAAEKQFIVGLGVPLEAVINRDLCKAPVMTTPYGVTPGGLQRQVRKALRKVSAFEARLAALPPDERKAMRSSIGSYVAAHVTEVMKHKLGRACDLMEWLQQTARTLVEHGKPPQWTTPAGLPVIQAYLHNERKRIRTELSHLKRFRCFSLTLKIPTDTLARKKAENGIVANFVHSHDAAHMMLTTLAAHAHGISGLRMIHDSFATHADQAALLARILREEFARMYEGHDPLAAFHAASAAQMGPAAYLLQLPPSKGSLDVRDACKSPHFFS